VTTRRCIVAMSKTKCDALKYSAMLAESALLRANDAHDREIILRYFKNIVKNFIDEGFTLADTAKFFPTHRLIFKDVYDTCIDEMGYANKVATDDFNTRS
jgi:hypothetical protein